MSMRWSCAKISVRRHLSENSTEVAGERHFLGHTRVHRNRDEDTFITLQGVLPGTALPRLITIDNMLEAVFKSALSHSTLGSRWWSIRTVWPLWLETDKLEVAFSKSGTTCALCRYARSAFQIPSSP